MTKFYDKTNNRREDNDMQKLRAFAAADEKRRDAVISLLRVLTHNVDVVLQELFDTHPQLMAVRWVQYSSYDKPRNRHMCVDDPTLLIGGGIHKVGDDSDWIYWNERASTSSDLVKNVYDMFNLLPSDVLTEKWGHRVRVKIARQDDRIVALVSSLDDRDPW